MKIIIDLIKGGIIGVANIIPGVSGGTMALVLGIYERIIEAIHNISLKTFTSFLKVFTFSKKARDDFREEMKKIDGFFLFIMGVGALGAIFSLATLMKYLLNDVHDPTYGFFFGLVLASVVVPYKMIKKKSITVLLCALLAVGAIVASSIAVSDEEKIHSAEQRCELRQQQNETAANVPAAVAGYSLKRVGYIFFLGAVTISTMILPGVSGSLLLLMLGGYYDTINALSNLDIIYILIFGAGCGFGLILFSRFLNFLLKKFHDQTMGFLLGLVLGSLWIIWPFKNSVVICEKVVDLSNTLPASFGIGEIITGLTILLGIIIVAAMIYVEGKKADN